MPLCRTCQIPTSNGTYCEQDQHILSLVTPWADVVPHLRSLSMLLRDAQQEALEKARVVQNIGAGPDARTLARVFRITGLRLKVNSVLRDPAGYSKFEDIDWDAIANVLEGKDGAPPNV